MYSNIQRFLPCLLMILLVSGCELFGGNDDPEDGVVDVAFEHYGNDQIVTLEQSSHQSEAGHSFTVTLLEYIVTDIALTHEDGTVVSLKGSHYVNKNNPDTWTIASTTIAPGTYTSLSFRFGIEGSENVFGTLERTLAVDNMIWPMMMPMGDGTTERYHYMRFEGRYGTDGVFRIHTGPSGGNDYSIDVSLALNMNVDGDDWSLDLISNIDEWLSTPHQWDFTDYGMIMGNQTAQNLVYENGHDVFEVGNVKIGL